MKSTPNIFKFCEKKKNFSDFSGGLVGVMNIYPFYLFEKLMRKPQLHYGTFN